MAYGVNYSALDRLLHRIAFAAPSIQLAAADIERQAFGARYRSVAARRPIFISSLPRAGTTLLLEVLHRFPSLATHTYRDMPFVMAPVLWSRLSGPFRQRAGLRERAHGDGMQIGYDSPEAFEEILWRAFWPEKYSKTRIALWQAADCREEAHAFLAEHMKKIVALRRPGRTRDGRYLSKNNGNIARLDLIRAMFPDAKILVPVRHPLAHTASLLRQHRNFVRMHREQPFVRRYMADIGHYEFGELHRPIAFPGCEALMNGRDSLTLNYWLGYWIAAFEYVLERRGGLLVVSYEATCAGGPEALAKLCHWLDIPEEGMANAAAEQFRAPAPPSSDGAEADARLRRRAEELYRALVSS